MGGAASTIHRLGSSSSEAIASGTVRLNPTVAAAGEVSMTALAHSVSESTLSAMPFSKSSHMMRAPPDWAIGDKSSVPL